MNSGHSATEAIAITGIGLVSSLGMDAPSSLAAIRSGIANFTEHEAVLVNGDQNGTELRGARIARLPEEALGRKTHSVSRAAALLAPAIKECLSRLPESLLSSVTWRLVDLNKTNSDEDRNLEEHLRQILRDLPIIVDGTGTTVTDPALGRCQFFETLIHAACDIRNGKASLVIVGCVHSLCEVTALEDLLDANRLKSANNPEGLIAGEAAGVFLLESEPHARQRGAQILSYLKSWGRGDEANSLTGVTPSTGTGLRTAFEEALSQLAGKGSEIDMVIADLNGERVRAYEWAYAASNIFPQGEKERELMHPADCTGDCGTAMGSVLLATAIAVMSDSSSVAQVALSTSDDHGSRRVLCVEKGDPSLDSAAVSPQPLNHSPATKQALTAVLEQHYDDATFLWLTRRRLLRSPHRHFTDLAEHNRRIQANLDGLFHAGGAGWEVAKMYLADGDAGDFFVASCLAFRSGDRDRIDFLLEMAGARLTPYKGIISALGWLQVDQVVPHVATLSTADKVLHRWAEIALTAHRRRAS